MITLNNIKQAQSKLNGVVHKTPLAYAPILSSRLGGDIYLKKENLQITGSFKLRGAFNKISNLSEEEKRAGVVAASAGNHAQGVAYSAKYYGCEATIVMPEATPLTKVSGVKSHGANVVLHGANYDESYKYATELASEQNKTFVHPYADDDVISGQGTTALEILDELDDIDTIVVPIGGGGLIAGIAIAVKAIKPEIKVVGVVASGAKKMLESFDQNKPLKGQSVKTIADGIAVRDVNPKMFELVKANVDEIVEVEENEIANAILFLLEAQKLVVEGAGAVSVAALMHNEIELKGKKTVAVVSGGNIDVTMLAQIIEKGLVKSNRKMNLSVILMDKPGALMLLTEIFKACDANIVQIDYNRNSVKLEFGEAYVTIALETKGEEHQKLIADELKKHGYSFTQFY